MNDSDIKIQYDDEYDNHTSIVQTGLYAGNNQVKIINFLLQDKK